MNKEMYLDEEYRINSIPLNFVLEKRHFRKSEQEDGTILEIEEWRTEGNYSTLRHLLRAYSEKQVLNSCFGDIDEIYGKLDSIQMTIERVPDLLARNMLKKE